MAKEGDRVAYKGYPATVVGVRAGGEGKFRWETLTIKMDDHIGEGIRNVFDVPGSIEDLKPLKKWRIEFRVVRPYDSFTPLMHIPVESTVREATSDKEACEKFLSGASEEHVSDFQIRSVEEEP